MANVKQTQQQLFICPDYDYIRKKGLRNCGAVVTAESAYHCAKDRRFYPCFCQFTLTENQSYLR